MLGLAGPLPLMLPPRCIICSGRAAAAATPLAAAAAAPPTPDPPPGDGVRRLLLARASGGGVPAAGSRSVGDSNAGMPSPAADADRRRVCTSRL